MDKTNYNFAWFQYAENDIEAAIILSEQNKPKFEIICYHCQQCADKMLKGYIAFNNGKLLKTHDLVVLCEVASKFDIEFETLLQLCADLTIFASEVRYPNTLEIDKHHTNKALEMAINIKNFILNKVK